jgi:hypothetical protein
MIEEHLKNNRGSYDKPLQEAAKKYEQLFFEEQEKYGDLVNDLNRLMKGWIAKWSHDGLTYNAVEVPFEIEAFEPWELNYIKSEYARMGREFPSDVLFVGKIDAIAHEENGMDYIVEHKTVQTIPEAGSEFTDLQTTLYMKALDSMGECVPKGILWDYIRTKSPTVPEPLKKGGLSVAKNMDTDVDTYMEAIVRHHLNPLDYTEYLNHLSETKANAFYKRTYMPNPKPSLIQIMWNDFQSDTIDIVMEGPRCRTKSITRDCKFCDYQPLCHAELFDNNLQFVLDANYQKRKAHV